MEEIVRRLRSRSRKELKSLKESMPIKGIREAEEDEEEKDTLPPEEELDFEEPSAAEDISPGDEEQSVPDSKEDEKAREDEFDVDEPSSDTNEYVNPLDNNYAVQYTIGDEVSLRYANGTKSKLRGTIEGYDAEGFYRVLWANGLTTNGITDIALADIVATKNESSCVCGNTNFVNEDRYVICDKCGRRIKESKSMRESKAYSVRYRYDGDSLSDYESNIIVVANSPKSALEIAKERKPEGRHFEIDHTYDSLSSFKSKYPKSNYEIFGEGLDQLTLADKERPKGKRMIRSEAHPMSTAGTPDISETIKRALKRPINEDIEDDVFYRLFSLEGEFWSIRDEMVRDIEELGYEVEEANGEYVLVADEDYAIRIPIGGTPRTMFLDFNRANRL